MNEIDRDTEAKALLAQIKRAGFTAEGLAGLDRHGELGSGPLVRDYVARIRALYPNPGTAATYATGWRLLDRVYGHWRIETITRTHLERLLEAARKRARLREAARTARRAEKGRAEHPGHGHGAVANALAALRAVFARADEEGLLPRGNPTDGLRPPQRRPNKRRPLNQREIEEVYTTATTSGNDPHLDALLLRTALETGARREGLVALRLADLDRRRQTVLLHEKNEKTREQPVTRRLLEELADFARRRGSTAEGDSVFCYHDGSALTERRFDYLFNRVQRKLAWADREGVTLHFVRHSAGKRIERLAGKAVTAEFLGHAAAGTTDVYTRACPLEVARAFEQMMGERHPLADEEASW